MCIIHSCINSARAALVSDSHRVHPYWPAARGCNCLLRDRGAYASAGKNKNKGTGSNKQPWLQGGLQTSSKCKQPRSLILKVFSLISAFIWRIETCTFSSTAQDIHIHFDRIQLLVTVFFSLKHLRGNIQWASPHRCHAAHLCSEGSTAVRPAPLKDQQEQAAVPSQRHGLN